MSTKTRLRTFTPGEQLLNFGRLTTSGDLAEGIFGAADDLNISNFSGIETTGSGAAGIFVLGNDADVMNFGSVVTRGDLFDPIPDEEGEESFSEGIVVIGDRFHIANFGRVNVEGDVSSAMFGVGADASLSISVARKAVPMGRHSSGCSVTDRRSSTPVSRR